MDKKEFHFVGIGGSGMSAVANLALDSGYVISGCDLNTNTPYNALLKRRCKIYEGHSKTHIHKHTQLVVSPAALFGESNSEVKSVKDPITWQNFLGNYLAKDKTVVCVAGTHGKSTTTALASVLLEEDGYDLSVMVGAKVNKWQRNYRTGNGNIFIIESDEFYDNFLNYNPDIIILTNIEFDHPDYFKSETQLFNSFKSHVESLKGLKTLIYNADDQGVQKLLKLISSDILRTIKLIPYSLTNQKHININLLGEHNQSNALAVLKLSEVFKVNRKSVDKVFKNFQGIGRRMELIHSNEVLIYDDYAHHPTAIKKTLKALREKYPNQTIHAVVEPHSFSRTKATLPLYVNAFKDVDHVYIAPIFKARDTQTHEVSERSIQKVANHKSIKSFKNSDLLIYEVTKNLKKGDVVIVMGAGLSYKIAKALTNKFFVNTSKLTNLHVGGKAQLIRISSEEDLVNALTYIKGIGDEYFMLGEGTNVLLADKLDKITFLKLENIYLKFKKNSVEVGAASQWDKFVSLSINKNLQGIECMSGIPGTVGAAPVQNIGAYGQEVKNVIVSIKVFDTKKFRFTIIKNKECKFSYRDSIFRKTNRYIIFSVTFKLKNKNKAKVSYKSLVDVLGTKEVPLEQIREQVLLLRKEKFGSLKGSGTAGSFFKNPIIKKSKLNKLLKDYPDIPHFESDGKHKLYGGWLIEHTGWKGKQIRNVKVSDKNALVLKNQTGKATAAEIYSFSEKIRQDVKREFDINLELEVGLIGFK